LFVLILKIVELPVETFNIRLLLSVVVAAVVAVVRLINSSNITPSIDDHRRGANRKKRIPIT
jgi:hypothetical protein